MGCQHVWASVLQEWRPRTWTHCVKCRAVGRDMEHYIIMLTKGMAVESVLDVGTGRKGPVAEHYWVDHRGIKEGYVCDVYVLKDELNPIWKKLKMNALDLLDVLGPKSVDVVQACGFLEHLTLREAIVFLRVAEKIARKLVYLSCATCCHGPDARTPTLEQADPSYKVERDGNPYHEYKTIWSRQQLELWGYKTNIRDITAGRFMLEGEVEAWKVFD